MLEWFHGPHFFIYIFPKIQLVEAFHATLEEVVEADFLLV